MTADLQLGRQPFDDQFVVSARELAAAQQVLSPRVQDLLLQLKLWLHDEELSEHVELTVDGSVVELRLGTWLTTATALHTFYDLGRQVCDELRLAG